MAYIGGPYIMASHAFIDQRSILHGNIRAVAAMRLKTKDNKGRRRAKTGYLNMSLFLLVDCDNGCLN